MLPNILLEQATQFGLLIIAGMVNRAEDVGMLTTSMII